METDLPLSATEQQAIERRLERGRLEEEARKARLAAQTNQQPRTGERGEVYFVHEPCRREFPSRRALGQHTRSCSVQSKPQETLVEHLLSTVIEAAHDSPEGSVRVELQPMPAEVSAVLPEPPPVAEEGTKIVDGIAHPVNKDGLTFVELMGRVLPDLAKKRDHLLAQEEGLRKALQANAVEIHDIEVALRVYEKIMKGDT